MKRGFSTLEILIAMAILISAFTITLLLASTQSITVDTETSSEALSVARKALEIEQSFGRKDFRLVVATTSVEGVSGTTYTKTVTVTQPDLFTKSVTAKVTWPGTYGRTPSTSLVGLITNFQNAVGGDTCSTVFSNPNGLTGWKTPVVSNATIATLLSDTMTNAPYPISGIDAYQKRLYVSVATSSSPVGPNNPNTTALDTSVGTISWTNTNNAKTSDNSYSTATFTSGQITQYLKVSNLGFNIPRGSTITGVKVEIERKGSSSSNTIKDYRVRLIRPDGTIGTVAKEHSTSWPTSDAYDTYTWTTTDLLSEANNWSPATINGSAFGVALAATSNGGSSSRTASVDQIRVSVNYVKQFYIFDIKNPANPVFLGGLATSTLSGSINAIAVATSSQNHFAYAATDSSSLGQLQVIDVTTPATPYIKGTFPTVSGTGMGTGVGTSIFYKDGYVYEGLASGGTGHDFNIIDVASNPAAPAWKGGYTVGASINAIVVKDGLAYLSTNDTSKELVVLNVTNPANPTLVTTYNATPDIANFGYGRGLYTVGDTVYLGRSWTNSGSIPQFYALDASGSTISQLATKSLGTNLSLRNIVVRDSLAFLLLGSATSAGNLQIINATSTAQYATPITLPPSGSGGQGGTALDCEGNYLYAGSMDSLNRGYLTSVTGQ